MTDAAVEAPVSENTESVSPEPPIDSPGGEIVLTDGQDVSSSPVTESPDAPLHQATCAHPKCKVRVVYRLTPSGHGFAILERTGCEFDAIFSAGETGRPACPHGHGELTGTDDLLSAEDAITEAARRVDEQKALRLPFPSPPFNYESALHTIQEKRHDVKQLERDFEKADERRKKAKAALDEANTELGQIIDAFEEREQERRLEMERRARRAADGHPDDTNLVRCKFEEKRPGASCPLCDGTTVDLDAREIAAKDSETHVEQAVAMLEQREAADLAESLETFCHVVIRPEMLRGLSPEARADIKAWVLATADPDHPTPARPAALGTAHIAAPVEEGAAVQSCRECGAVLLRLGDADIDDDPYPAGTFVGVDCPSVADVAHHYPKPRGEKAKRAKTEKAPASKKVRKAGKQ